MDSSFDERSEQKNPSSPPQPSNRIHVQYHGNMQEVKNVGGGCFEWDDDLDDAAALMMSSAGPDITKNAIEENTVAQNHHNSPSSPGRSAGPYIGSTVDDFEEFNLDDCEELTEEEKELLMMYIHRNQGSAVFPDDVDDEDHQEPLPDYGDYFSGRYLETIYEEESDDLRSFDSEDEEILAPSPSSDEHLGLQSGKLSPMNRINCFTNEHDKDSSYDSDFSMVNSTECLDEHQQHECVGVNKNDDHTNLMEDDELKYNENDIEDVLCGGTTRNDDNNDQTIAVDDGQQNILIKGNSGKNNFNDLTIDYCAFPSRPSWFVNDDISTPMAKRGDFIQCVTNVDDDDSGSSGYFHGDDDYDRCGFANFDTRTKMLNFDLKKFENNFTDVNFQRNVNGSKDKQTTMCGLVAPSIDAFTNELNYAECKRTESKCEVREDVSDNKLLKSSDNCLNNDKIALFDYDKTNANIRDDRLVTEVCGAVDVHHNEGSISWTFGEEKIDFNRLIITDDDHSHQPDDDIENDEKCNEFEITNSHDDSNSRINPFADNIDLKNFPSPSASNELYDTLPRINELPDLKEVCDSWFTKDCIDDNVNRVCEMTAVSSEWVTFEGETKDETSVGIQDATTGMCGKYSGEKNWEQWLARSLDEKSGRGMTPGNLHHNAEGCYDTSAIDSQISDEFGHDDNKAIIVRETTSDSEEDEIDRVIYSHDQQYFSRFEDRRNETTRSEEDIRRRRSLPRNYESERKNDDDYLESNQPSLLSNLVNTRGNSSVGVSLESPSRLQSSCDFISSPVRLRSKSTPDLSSTGRVETLVKRIGHTSQVQLEVCELSPGLQYKKHCVIVNESVSAKKAKFEALSFSSPSPNRGVTQTRSTPGIQCRVSGAVVTRDKVKNAVLLSTDNVQHLHCADEHNALKPRTATESTTRDRGSNLTPEAVNFTTRGIRQEEEKNTTTGHFVYIPSQVDCIDSSFVSSDGAPSDCFEMLTDAQQQSSSSSSSPSNDMLNANQATQQHAARTDVSKLVAMFENEIRKSEPCITGTLVVNHKNYIINERTPSRKKTTLDVSPEHFNRITGLRSGIKATATKPPLPLQQEIFLQESCAQGVKYGTPRTIKYINARKHFLESEAVAAVREKQCQPDVEEIVDGEDEKLVNVTFNRLSQFNRSAREERARLAKSVPNLVSNIDTVIRSSKPGENTDRQKQPPKSALRSKDVPRRHELSKSRNEDEWERILSAAAVHYGQRYEKAKERSELSLQQEKLRSKSSGYLETDIDTLECRQVNQTNIDDVFNDGVTSASAKSRAKSMMSLDANKEDGTGFGSDGSVDGSRAKSMEFLLDDDNKAAVVAPENQLMRNGKTPSEHEIRIKRSLKNLTLPNWYKEPDDETSNSIVQPRSAIKVKTNEIPASSSSSSIQRWQGFGSKSSSSNSLSANKSVIIPKRVTPDWRCVKYGIQSSREGVTTPRTPNTCLESPSGDDSNSGFYPSFSRMTTTRLSNTSIGSSNFGGGGSTYRSFRQPYLGWRSSVEKLSAMSGGQPSSSSSQCPSPSSSAISAASSSYVFRSNRFGGDSTGLSRWGNLGAVNLNCATDTDSDGDFYSRPSSAQAGQYFHGKHDNDKLGNNLLSWRPDDQQTEPSSQRTLSDLQNGHLNQPSGFDQEGVRSVSPSKLVWMESSFVGKKNEQNLNINDVTSQFNPINGDLESNETSEQRLDATRRHQESHVVKKKKATLDEVLDSLLCLPSSRSNSKFNGAEVSLTSRSSNDLSSDYTNDDRTNQPSKKNNCFAGVYSESTTPLRPDIDRDYDQSLNSTTMEFRRVAQELSEKIRSLKNDPSQAENFRPMKDEEDDSTSSVPNCNDHDHDILQQYSCDYSCLNMKSNDNGISLSANVGGILAEEDIDGLSSIRLASTVCNDRDSEELLPSPELDIDKTLEETLMMEPPEQDPFRSCSESRSPPDVVVRCSHPRCTITAVFSEAQRSFKSCHYCFTVYCCRLCRRAHWDKHRRVCMFVRVSKMCENTILKIKNDTKSRNELSKYARTGYLTKGRGVLKLVFSCPEFAWHFIDRGWTAVLENPIYVALQDLLPQEMGADAYVEVRNLCHRYNPENKFVLIVAIYVTTQIRGIGIKKTPAAGYEREVLMKCTKMRLSPSVSIWKPKQDHRRSAKNVTSTFGGNDVIR